MEGRAYRPFEDVLRLFGWEALRHFEHISDLSDRSRGECRSRCRHRSDGPADAPPPGSSEGDDGSDARRRGRAGRGDGDTHRLRMAYLREIRVRSGVGPDIDRAQDSECEIRET